MSSKGWIKLHRRIRDHWTYQEKRTFSKFEAWIDLLMRANHKDNKILLGNELIEVKRGQFITSELKLMNAWGWGKSKTRNFLKLLEDDGMIIKESDRKKTIITICNYNLYHENEKEDRPQADYKQTISRLSSDTNKNDKECIKNDKEDDDDTRVNPFVFFENEGFGMLTEIIADDLGDLIDTHGENRVIYAMKEAVLYGARNLKYVRKILENPNSKRGGNSGKAFQQYRGSLNPPEREDSITGGQLGWINRKRNSV